jgi:hypothetical protein
MIRTFFDSGVLIAGARSVGRDRERALQLLEEPNRVFLTSPFVHLEEAIYRSTSLRAPAWQLLPLQYLCQADKPSD